MKKIFTCLLFILLLIPVPAAAQLFQQDFSGTLTAGNSAGGTIVSNGEVTADPAYVAAAASSSQFTFLATNNALASIELKGDGVMRLNRDGSGTVYVVRNADFTGSPSALKVSFNFNAEVTNGTSTSAIQFMLGESFPNTKNEPAAANKHSRFYVNTKSPTGTPGTWGVTPVSDTSSSAYTTAQTVTWFVNNSGQAFSYTAPDGTAEILGNDKYDVWVGNVKHINDAAALTDTADLKNIEIRIAGGKGIYTVDNLVITELTGTPISSSINDYFRTKNNGGWNNKETWESSPDGSYWMDAAVSPNDSSNTITISEGDTVTVISSVTVDQLNINTGGVIVVNGSPVVFTVANGTADIDAVVNGTIKVTGTAAASPGPYSVSLNEGAAIQFGNGAVYEHNQDAGAIPAAEWDLGSTLKLTAIVSKSPANGNQNFSNVEWNSPGQLSNLNLGWNNITINGEIKIISTGSGRWQMCAPKADSSATVNIQGDIIQTGGNFTSNGTGNANTIININHWGDVLVTGGNFSVSRGSQAGTGVTNWYLYGENISVTDATTQNSNAAGAKFIFARQGIQNLTLNNVNFGGGGFPVEVNSLSVLNLGSSQIRGNGIFTLKQAAALATAHFGGIDSALITTGTKTLDPGASYIFNGTDEQVTGELPSVINKLIINNPAGVILSNDITLNDTLFFTSGDLNINGKTITLGAEGFLSETSGNTLKGTSGSIVVTRNIGTPGGVNVGGLGAVITADKDLGSTAVERYNAAATHAGNHGILRYYKITPGQNSTGLNASLRFYYDESELNGLEESTLKLYESATGADNSWTGAGGTVNTDQNYIELTGITDFSYWTAGSENTPLPVELTSFTASVQNKRIILRWQTTSELNNYGWDIERRSQNSAGWEKIGFVRGSGDRTVPAVYTFTDNTIHANVTEYRLKQLDHSGTFVYSKVLEVKNAPVEFLLHQNYPNPFNPETRISIELPEASFINLSVYNTIGELVTTIVNKNLEPGFYSFTYDAADMNSGIYIYQLRAGTKVFTKKMMLVR